MRCATRGGIAHGFTSRVLGSLALLSTSVASALALVVTSVCLTVSLGACDKPKQADCKKAVANIRRIYGTQGLDYGTDPQSMVRSCRGSASHESVECFITAKSMEDLRSCEGGMFEELGLNEDEGKDEGKDEDKPEDKDEGKPDTPATAPATTTPTAPSTTAPSTATPTTAAPTTPSTAAPATPASVGQPPPAAPPKPVDKQPSQPAPSAVDQ